MVSPAWLQVGAAAALASKDKKTTSELQQQPDPAAGR
jgi:hypothetical protein